MGESLKKKFLFGASWTTSEQIIMTLVGVLQLAITSRLLTPIDFGVYAVANFFAGLGRISFSMGLSAALIQKKGDIRPYLDTTWAASVLVASVISAIIMGLIPFICIYYFHNSDAIWPSLLIMCSCIFIAASNPGMIFYNREIRLKRIFYLDVSSKFFSFLLVIFFVLYTKSYWGLIIALLAESVFKCSCSYFLHPYRPKLRFKWEYFKELYAFSGWIQLRNIINWLAGSIDTAIVGNILGAERLGFYNRAQSVSQFAPGFVNAVVDSVAFPLYSQINDDKNRTNKIVISVQNVMICLMSLVSIIFIRYSDKVINIVLGEKWTTMSYVFSVLGIAYLTQALLLSFNSVLRAYGYTRQEFVFYVLKLTITIALLYPFVERWDIEGAAWAITISVIIAFPFMMFLVWQKTKLQMGDFYFSIFIAVISVISTNYLIGMFEYYFRSGCWWLFEMVISFLILCLIELCIYLVIKKGPGEAIYKSLHS